MGAERRKAKGKSPTEPLPVDIGNSQVGERVRQLRIRRGWSLESLADASGVSRSMLSQIERDQTNPTLYVACRIAQAFDLTLGELVETPSAASAISVIRADDHAYHYRSGRKYRIRTLSPVHFEKDVEFYEVRIPRGGAMRSAAHFEGTREFLTVQKGCVRLESGRDIEVLREGDSASYRADRPHALCNHGPEESVVFLVDIFS